jgi:hypothetical protein
MKITKQFSVSTYQVIKFNKEKDTWEAELLANRRGWKKCANLALDEVAFNLNDRLENIIWISSSFFTTKINFMWKNSIKRKHS